MARIYRMNGLARFGNSVTTVMIRLGVGPAGLRLLRVPGRTTGLARMTPVNVIEVDGRRWLVAPYGEVGWVRNVRAAGEADLLRGGRVEHVRPRDASADEAIPVLRAYLGRLRRVVGPYFDVTPDSPDAAFAAEAPRHPVFLITA